MTAIVTKDQMNIKPYAGGQKQQHGASFAKHGVSKLKLKTAA